MKTHPRRPVTYDLGLMEMDLAANGLNYRRLAAKLGVNPSRVTRFFNGEVQTHPTAKMIAKGLGRSVRRYLRLSGVAA